MSMTCYDVMRKHGGSPFYWDEDYNPLSHPHKFKRIDDLEFRGELEQEWVIWHPGEMMPKEFYVEKED